MTKSPHQGFLLIADITGYTTFLSQSELEHAQGILTNLLELLVSRTRPPLVLSRLAGDAVIAYGLRDTFLQGQTFVESIEETYVAFKRAIEVMALNNSCLCNACANVGALDLKFFVHYGEFAVQRLSAHDELLGNDVNLIHRLLKNQVVERTRIHAYTLYTQAAVDALELQQFAETLAPYAEQVEPLGTVQAWVQDMTRVWEARRGATRIAVHPASIEFQAGVQIAALPEQVWDFLVDPHHRAVLMNVAKMGLDRNGGRIGPGSVYQCYHGDHASPQTVIEWTAFERMITEDQLPLPLSQARVRIAYAVRPHDGGTEFTQTFFDLTGPWLGRTVARLGLIVVGRMAKRDLVTFKTHVEREIAERTVPEGLEVSRDVIAGAAAESLAR